MQFEPSTWALLRLWREHHEPGRRHPRRRPPALVAHGAPGNLRQTHASPTTTPTSYVHLRPVQGRPLRRRRRRRPSGRHGSAVCQQAALRGPLPRQASAGEDPRLRRGPARQAPRSSAQGGRGPDAFDCSGLAMMAYRAAGIIIPAPAAGSSGPAAPRIPASQVQPGDLVFFSGARRDPRRPPGTSASHPGPRRPHHDQRLHRRLPRGSGHLRAQCVEGRAVARGGLHPCRVLNKDVHFPKGDVRIMSIRTSPESGGGERIGSRKPKIRQSGQPCGDPSRRPHRRAED